MSNIFDMISEGILKAQFINRVLERDQRFILNTQRKVIADNYHRVGTLFQHLSSHPISVHGSGSKVTMALNYLTYLRFLDISSKRDKNLRSDLSLYNRVIWGRLYNETLLDLRSGYNQEIEENIYNQLNMSII